MSRERSSAPHDFVQTMRQNGRSMALERVRVGDQPVFLGLVLGRSRRTFPEPNTGKLAIGSEQQRYDLAPTPTGFPESFLKALLAPPRNRADAAAAPR